MNLLREYIRELMLENEQSVMFHGTSSAYLEDILSQGLKSGHMPGATAAATKKGWKEMLPDLGTDRVFLTSDRETAKTYANWTSGNGKNGEPIILIIDASNLQLVPDPLEKKGYTTDFVPANRISVEGRQ
jgi:RNA:NAD 2'-phosphotransferase (TPT1/KptA family)